LQNSVNHRIFERTLRPLVFRGAHPFECRENLNLFGFFWGPKQAWTLEAFCWHLSLLKGQLLLNELAGSSLPILDV
jgi:hypothetical protein